MYVTTRALVLRAADYKESSRMLTLLTESDGKISAAAKGVRRKNSKLAAAAQLYAFSEVTLSHSGGRWYLNEGNALELFPGIGLSIENLALAAYFSELLETVCREDIPEPELLRLALNTFFALSEGKKSPALIKAAFEMRLMCQAGYAPPLEGCAACGNPDPAELVFALEGDGLMCRSCAAASGAPRARLCASSLAAMRYIEEADDRRVFSFNLSDDALERLSDACEKYVRQQLERDFRTLDYYKKFGAGQ